METRHRGTATTTLIVTLCLLQFFGKIPVFPWIWHNPFLVLELLFAYVLIGGIYSILKWTSFVYKKRDEDRGHDTRLPPQAKAHKSEIIGWMAYWPFSAIWTFLSNPLYRLFQIIYVRCEHLFQSISDRAYAKTK